MLHILQMIQKAGYGDTLEDGPQSSWLGYSLLPEGFFLWSFTRHLYPSWPISIKVQISNSRCSSLRILTSISTHICSLATMGSEPWRLADCLGQVVQVYCAIKVEKTYTFLILSPDPISIWGFSNGGGQWPLSFFYMERVLKYTVNTTQLLGM